MVITVSRSRPRRGELGSQEQPIVLSDDDGSEVVESTGEAYRSASSRKGKDVERKRNSRLRSGGRVTEAEAFSSLSINRNSIRKGKGTERDGQVKPEGKVARAAASSSSSLNGNSITKSKNAGRGGEANSGSRAARVEASPSMRIPIPGNPSRKGKEVGRDYQMESGAVIAQAATSSSRNTLPSPLKTPIISSDSSHHTTRPANPSPLAISFPVKCTVEGLADLVNPARLQSGSTSTWEYVRFSPPSASSNDRAFRCTYPHCRAQIGFRDRKGDRRIWFKIPELVDVHNHDHPAPSRTQARPQSPVSSSRGASKARTPTSVPTSRPAQAHSITMSDRIRHQRDETKRKSTPHLQSPIKPKSSPAERILHVSGSATHSATRKTGTSTPQSRRKRLDSAVSFSTPTPRQTVAAGSSGFGETLDSPEEEEEQVENLPPSMPGSQHSVPHQKEDAGDDILAEFLDFDFGPPSPEQLATSLNGDVPATPSRHSPTERPTPRPEATDSRAPPGPQDGKLATASGSQTTPRQKTLSIETTLPAHSPVQLQSRVSAVEMTFADQIREDARKEVEKQQKRLQDSEALAKRTAAALDSDNEEDDLAIQRIKQQLNFDLEETIDAIDNRRDMDEESSQGGEPGPSGIRRSARLRSGSITSQTRRSVPPSTSRMSVPSKNSSTDSDRLLAEYRQQAKQGYRNGDAEKLLRDIAESESPTKPEHHPYPTPDSNGSSIAGGSDDEAEADDGDLSDMNLDLLARSDLDGVRDVARELQQSRRGSRQREGIAAMEWDGFWAKESTETTEATASLDDSNDLSAALRLKTSTFKFMFEGMSSATLASLSASGVHALRIWKTEISIPDEVIAAVVETNADKRRLIVDRSVHRFEVAKPGVVTSQKILEMCTSIWQACGARPILFKDVETRPLGTLAMSGYEACHYVCRILNACLNASRVSPQDARKLSQPLLLLAVERTIPAGLKTLVRSMLNLLWPLCLEDGDMTETELASEMSKLLEPLPAAIKIQILFAVGETTDLSEKLSRRLAIEWLVPGCLDRSISDGRQDEPTLPTLIFGGERILAMVHERDTSIEAVNECISFMYASLTDMDYLVRMTSETTGVSDEDHPVRDLRALVAKISRSLRMSGNDTQRIALSQAKSRISQLAIVLEMQYETTFKRVKKARMELRVGKGLKAGANGQAMLSFSKNDDDTAQV